MPEDLDQVAAAAPKIKRWPVCGSRFEISLNCKSQASHAATHVGVASRDPNPDAARNRDHRRPVAQELAAARQPPRHGQRKRGSRQAQSR